MIIEIIMKDDKRTTICNQSDVYVHKGDRIVIDMITPTMSHNRNGEYVVSDTRLILRHNSGTTYGAGLVREIEVIEA